MKARDKADIGSFFFLFKSQNKLMEVNIKIF